MRTVGILLVAGLACGWSLAQAPREGGNPPGPAAAPKSGAGDERASAAAVRLSGANLLRLRFSTVDLNEVTLREAFEWLAEVTQINVVVRWDMLSAAGVEEDALVSVRARNMRLGQVLWMMLNQVSTGGNRLAYRLSGEMILISSEADLSQEMIVRVYDVTDIVATELAVPEIGVGRTHEIPLITGIGVAPGAAGVDLRTQVVRSGTRVRSSNPTGIEEEDYDSGDGGFSRRMQELVEMITATVEPESWDVNGGNGTIRAYRGMIVVRNSPFVHQQLGGAIEE